MAFTTFTAEQAVKNAKSYNTYQTGMCLNFVYNCIAKGGSYDLPWAQKAWDASKQKVTDGSTPPAGAPVYWSGGSKAYGHVAISLGNGLVRSTDIPEKGKVGDIKIADLSKNWGFTLLGWTRDYAGDIIKGLEAPVVVVPPKPPVVVVPPVVTQPVLQPGCPNSKAVYNLQSGLMKVFPHFSTNIRTLGGGPNEIYGPQTQKSVKEFQTRSGLLSDAIVGPVTWKELGKYGIKP